MPDAELAAVILAGGRGTRMGGVDKGWASYQGRPLVAWVLDALTPQVDEIVISANRTLDRYAATGHRVLPDTLPDYPGPLAGVLAAMQAVSTPWLLVVPCDMPSLPNDLAARLIEGARDAGRPVAVAADDTRTHYTCFVVRTELAEDLENYLMRGERAVHRWQAVFEPAVVHFAAGQLINVNQLPEPEVD